LGKAVLITNARIATGAAATASRNLWLQNGLVYFSPRRTNTRIKIDLGGFLILPGLINAHDHLEFNLFPRLGKGPYPNATAWAKDIFHPAHSPIKEQLAISKPLRLLWGGLKNLVSGVTTVAHHNSYHPAFQLPSFPVRTLRRYGWAHSLQFSPDWLTRFRQTPEDDPFIIHACEGTDGSARQELEVLTNAGALRDSTVFVHGVALEETDVRPLAERHTTLIWCPTSNKFTLGRTIHPAILRSDLLIALGSDSGLTAAGDLLDELRDASSSTIDADRLYRSVTTDAAKVLKLPAGFGEIRHGGPADFLIMADNGQTPIDALLTGIPLAVIIGGALKLTSPEFARISGWPIRQPLQSLKVETRGPYLVAHDIRSLMSKTKAAFGGELRLAGKVIAA
jgi:cytosine/adenosine deaminase-related metal-dependent hydrolase